MAPSSGKSVGRLKAARSGLWFQKIAAGIFFGALVLFWAYGALAQASYSLKGITLEDAPGEFTIILWTDPPIKDYHYSFPRKPPRLTVDLPGKWKKPDKRSYRLENDTVRRVSVSHVHDRLRVSLHLKTGRIFEPFIYDSIKGLIITIKKAHLFTGPLPEGVKVAEYEPAGGAASAGSISARAEQNDSGKLASLDVSELPNGFRLTASMDKATESCSAFAILDQSPPKVVLDIKGSWKNPGKTVRQVAGDSIRQVRIGEHPEHLRIVVDLAVEWPPTIEARSEGNTVVLEVRKPFVGGN